MVKTIPGGQHKREYWCINHLPSQVSSISIKKHKTGTAVSAPVPGINFSELLVWGKRNNPIKMAKPYC